HCSCRRFSKEDGLNRLRERGMTGHTRPDGRVFPDSGRADDVVNALAWHLLRLDVQIDLAVAVTGIGVEDGRATGAWSGGHFYPAGTVILCAGGSSYPKTGTTGDGYSWARQLGNTLVPLRSALAPIYLHEGAPGQ